MRTRKPGFAINGKAASLKEIRDITKENALQRALGDYISGREAYRAGINSSTLRRWRNGRGLRARNVGNTWYYSRQDLLHLLKTEPSRLIESK